MVDLSTLAARLQLDAELRRWTRLGVKPRLWWRDDDVRAPSEALDRLLNRAGDRPLALAVIPDGDLKPLAARLREAANVSVGQHGVDHKNRRPPGETPSEYVAPPEVSELVKRIARGRDRLRAAGLLAVFYTPPWNAVDEGLDEAVARIGIPLLSAGGETADAGALPHLPAEIDILRWKGGARFKGEARILSALRRALETRRTAGRFERPIGLLTHHLDHDEASWRFLAWAMPLFDRAFDWVSVESAARPLVEVHAA